MNIAFSSPLMTAIAGKRQLLEQTREVLASVDPESGQVLWSHAIVVFRGMNIFTLAAVVTSRCIELQHEMWQSDNTLRSDKRGLPAEVVQPTLSEIPRLASGHTGNTGL